MRRIGVFVCHCGSNIAATVDVKKVVEMALLEQGVVHAEDYPYMCSEAGQSRIGEAIREKQLEGIVVCSCSPRMHEATFRKCAERYGLNPYLVEIANIREHCSWIHKDMQEATEKAVILMRAAVAKVRLNAPLKAGESAVTKRALVIGGGIAGIQTALDIADAGYQVDIVEKEPSIGGRMSQLDKTFPTLDCSACILTPKMVEAAAHENITIHTWSEVDKVSGFVGNFTVDIRKKARYVNMDKCTGCGICQEKCPSKKSLNEFNRGLNTRSAIYTPFAQAIPNVPVIDATACIKLKTGKCGICEKFCQAGAIDYTQKDEIITQQYGAIVVATGFDTVKLDKYGEYAYNESKDVITSLELERIMNAAGPTKGHLERLSDGKAPKEIVFIQCVGSRCSDSRGKPYCSKICCMYTAKHAMLIRDKYPDTNVTVFYIDVRTPGKNFDEFYRRAVEEYGVNYIKGQVGKVAPQSDGSLLVHGVDLLENKQLLKKADMVVLATAIEPNKDVRKIATMLTASIDTNNFLTEAHPKLRPVESPTAGVFLSGVCQGPKDIPETVAQAGAAAVKVIGLLAKDKLKTNPCTAKADELRCNGCSQCAHVCPYGAISYETRLFNDHGIREDRRIAVVNSALCQGCGCRHGFCGACAIIYRIKGKNELKTCLACQTQVQEGMYVASFPFFPTDKRTYTIGELKADQRVMMELYPEIYACIGCNACTKACTQSLNVMQYIAYAQRGELEKCAEESFDCVGCGCCSVRCPAGISHPMVGLLARRLTGKYIAPKAEHLHNRVEEVNSGAYDGLIEAIMQKPITEMQELYNHRDIEK